MQAIDFVIPWVDGADPAWLTQKHHFVPCVESAADGRDERYRDWGLLRYWFRGVEKNAPWVRKIHFVTCGHLPPWLNTAHPKLHIVQHRDYIPQKYLPTFSSHTIELNMHRMEGLSEQFVYFNDDTFILRPINSESFFRHGMPCDSALMNPIYTMDLAEISGDSRIFYIPYNDVQYLNRHFDMRSCVKRNFRKWYSLKYGTYLLRNLFLAPWPRFVGFVDTHLPQPFLKLSFEEAWNDSADILDQTCSNRIRTDQDVNQWYIRYRQLAQGRFYPAVPHKNACYQISSENIAIFQAVRQKRHPLICINDSFKVGGNFEEEKRELIAAFDDILPEKSSFERNV